MQWQFKFTVTFAHRFGKAAMELVAVAMHKPMLIEGIEKSWLLKRPEGVRIGRIKRKKVA